MATATLLTSGSKGWEAASVDTFTTAAVSPGADCLLVLLVGAIQDDNQSINVVGSPPEVTVVTSGLTWTVRATEGPPAGYTAHSAVWTAPVGSDPGSITVQLTSNYVAAGGEDIGSYCYALYRVTGYDTGTPIGGKISEAGNTGNGAVSVTLDAAPASGDITLALSRADATETSVGATFDTGWSQDATGVGGSTQGAWNAGQRTGSTSTTVAWTDVNTGTESYSSTQVAIVVKAGGPADVTGTAVGTLTVTGVASGTVVSPPPALRGIIRSGLTLG